jgi:hypothetical protein
LTPAAPSIFAQANGVGEVQWSTMEPQLRETMLARGDLDAVTGYTFTSLLNLEARGIKREDVVVLPYATHGVQLYGNVIIASPRLIAENRKPCAPSSRPLRGAPGKALPIPKPPLHP